MMVVRMEDDNDGDNDVMKVMDNTKTVPFL